MVCPECEQPFSPRMNIMNPGSEWQTCASCGKRVSINSLVEKRDMHIASRPYGYQRPDFNVELKTTSTGTNSGVTGTLATNLTIAKNSSLVVVMAYANGAGSIDGMTWNSLALTSRVTGSAGASDLVIYTRDAAAAGTGDLTFNATTATNIAEWVAYVFEVSKPTGAAINTDRTKTASGTSSAPSSGALANATQFNSEVILGAVGYVSPTVSGTWTNFMAQFPPLLGPTYSCDAGFFLASNKDKFTVGKTGAPNVDWSCSQITLR
jgi:hypothetical protein